MQSTIHCSCLYIGKSNAKSEVTHQGIKFKLDLDLQSLNSL